MKLTVFQAGPGDCLLLESADGKRILVDGGTATAYQRHVAPALGALREAGKTLDLIYLSHIDGDHIGGILALLDTELDWRVHDFQIAGGNVTHPKPKAPRPPAVGGLWHNAFAEQVSRNPKPITDLLATSAAVLDFGSDAADRDLAAKHRDLGTSVDQGIRLSRRASAQQLKIPLNREFGGKLALVRDGQVPITLGALELTLVGPFAEDLDNLRKEWTTWLAANQRQLGATRARMRADVQRLGTSEVELFQTSLALQADDLGDRSQVTAPNLASLMVLVREGDKQVLLTGDGHADDILKGLEHAGHHAIHVDVLKLQHHGSEFNLTPDFCQRVTADQYVICANGGDDNPDPRTLDAILDARLATPGPPFQLHFNSSPNAPDTAHDKAHMAGIAERVAAAREQAAPGRFSSTFLDDHSFTVAV